MLLGPEEPVVEFQLEAAVLPAFAHGRRVQAQADAGGGHVHDLPAPVHGADIVGFQDMALAVAADQGDLGLQGDLGAGEVARGPAFVAHAAGSLEIEDLFEKQHGRLVGGLAV